MLFVATALLVGCTSSGPGDDAAPDERVVETTENNLIDSDFDIVNEPVPIGEENFEEIFLRLNAISMEAERTNNLQQLETVVAIEPALQDLRERIEKGQRRTSSIDDYSLNELVVWFQPDEDTVVLQVTDTFLERVDYENLNGDFVRTEQFRANATATFFTTLGRGDDGRWRVVDSVGDVSTIRFTAAEIAEGPIETLDLQSGPLSTWKRSGQLCAVHHEPVAVFCVDDATVATWAASSDIGLQWRTWPSSKNTVLMVMTSAPQLDVLVEDELLDSVVTVDGIKIAVDPDVSLDDQIAVAGANGVANVVGVAGDG